METLHWKKKYTELLDAIDDAVFLGDILYENTPGVYEEPHSQGYQLTIFNALKNDTGHYKYNEKNKTIKLV
jgi:hypothetical protein